MLYLKRMVCHCIGHKHKVYSMVYGHFMICERCKDYSYDEDSLDMHELENIIRHKFQYKNHHRVFKEECIELFEDRIKHMIKKGII